MFCIEGETCERLQKGKNLDEVLEEWRDKENSPLQNYDGKELFEKLAKTKIYDIDEKKIETKQMWDGDQRVAILFLRHWAW